MTAHYPRKTKHTNDAETSVQPGSKRKKLARTALTLREKALVKSFCEQKVNDCKAQGKLMPSQECLRREVATQFGWSCGRSTLSRILSMDWKILRGSCEGGNAVRNLDMKRHRRPLFPAFEADLVKFILARMEEDGGDVGAQDAAGDTHARDRHGSASVLPVVEKKEPCASGDTAGGGQGGILTEALILEEAQRLKKLHGVSDEMLVLSVGWLARLKHRYCIRLRKPVGTFNQCSLPLQHQFGFAAEGSDESTGTWSSSLITCSVPDPLDVSEQAVPHQPVLDGTTDIASTISDPLPSSTQHAGNMELTGNSVQSIQSTLLKRRALCSAQWHQGETANPSTTTTELLRQIPESIRKLACSCQGSATVDTLFRGIAGLRVTVVGFGSVVEAFLTAALIGVGGFVTCVEANPANVYIAEQAADNFCLVTLGLPAVNMKFIVGEYGGMAQSVSPSCAVGDELKNLQGQTDIAICNCSIQSLKFPASKTAMLELAFGLLKVGGELRVTDLVSSRRLSSSECEEAFLAVEASPHQTLKQSEQKLLLGAPYVGDLQRLFRALGGDADVRSLSCNEAEAATIDVAAASLLPTLTAANNVKFRRVTFHVFRLQHVEDPCEDYGQKAVFNGCDIQDKAAGARDFSSSYQLDDNWNFRRGVSTPVDGNTAHILQTSWMQRYFSVSGDRTRHRGPFVASAYSMDCLPAVSQLAASAPGDTMHSSEVVEAKVADLPSSTTSSSPIDPLEMVNI